MKKCFRNLYLFFGLLSFSIIVSAQSTTIILLRHAEKDTSNVGSVMMTANPPLSKAGELRAERLVSVLSSYKPDIIYSTNYLRTKATVSPIAKKFDKEIQIYDPKKLQSFADSLIKVEGKIIVVVGHSNTTPALVNLLIRENKYPALDDSVYDQYWIVTITNKKTTVEQRKY